VQVILQISRISAGVGEGEVATEMNEPRYVSINRRVPFPDIALAGKRIERESRSLQDDTSV
jgi:hypothetical protein